MKRLFSQSGQIFPQFRVFEAIFEALGNFFFLDIQKLRLYLLLYSKRQFQSHGFNEKIGLKNGPPCAEIFVKKN